MPLSYATVVTSSDYLSDRAPPRLFLQHLPVNDTWLFAGCDLAASARDLLDYLALNGGVTAMAVVQLSKLVQVHLLLLCPEVPGWHLAAHLAFNTSHFDLVLVLITGWAP